MLNNGFYIEYRIGEKKSKVSFPYLNDDYFIGFIKIDSNSLKVSFRKGTYIMKSGN